MDKRILGFISLGIGIFGLIFTAVGFGIFFGFAVPEMRDEAIASNAELHVQTAVVSRYQRTNTQMNNDWMYRLVFEWDGNTAQTTPSYLHREATAMVGESIQIRVDESGRAVPVNFQPSPLSILGWVFLWVFGGIGSIAIIISLFVLRARNRRRDESEQWPGL